MTSLNENELEEGCTKFAETFSHDGPSDVEINDLISELMIIRFTLTDGPMSSVIVIVNSLNYKMGVNYVYMRMLLEWLDETCRGQMPCHVSALIPLNAKAGLFRICGFSFFSAESKLVP